MGNVLTVNNKAVIILNIHDFEYLVEQIMGLDAADYLKHYIELTEEDLRVALAEEDSDLHNYEASLESNHRAFQDIQDEIQVLGTFLNEPRLNRQKMTNAVQNIKTIISNQI